MYFSKNISDITIKITLLIIAFSLLAAPALYATSYPDQFYVLRGDSIFLNIITNSDIVLSGDGKRIQLAEGVTYGYAVLKPDSAQHPFDRGLPSWNGTVTDDRCAFKVQMRFPYNNGWSPWLTVGFWKENVWSPYGKPSYSGGKIDYDYAILYSYQSAWQFKIIMYRPSASYPSPTLHKLSFFISDSRTTDEVNISQLVQDKPDEIFIPTDFLYQYGIDPQIGGSICSPTSVAMILLSYDIEVDPLQFARDTQDPNFGLFGIWPRVVQNASEYGLDGAVTRYRSWSQAREVLARGGRIAMSVGQPLYDGHLMMLAGFNAYGVPIVHDPARSNGYSYVFNKTSLSQSWFNKGGIAYTFFPPDSAVAAVTNSFVSNMVPDGFELFQNYPNPFNPATNIHFSTATTAQVTVTVYDLEGRLVETLHDGILTEGRHSLTWHAGSLPSGVYYVRMISGGRQQTIKTLLMR